MRGMRSDGNVPGVMIVFQHVFALCAVGGFLGLVWLGVYAEVEGYERLADILDPGYHWQVIRALIAMPLVWALATLAALGIAWTFAEAPEFLARGSASRDQSPPPLHRSPQV
jgi:membrane-bound acyltransferase YfiQ involved in biofilm formation